jgi:hypothetical protein
VSVLTSRSGEIIKTCGKGSPLILLTKIDFVESTVASKIPVDISVTRKLVVLSISVFTVLNRPSLVRIIPVESVFVKRLESVALDPDTVLDEIESVDIVFKPTEDIRPCAADSVFVFQTVVLIPYVSNVAVLTEYASIELIDAIDV